MSSKVGFVILTTIALTACAAAPAQPKAPREVVKSEPERKPDREARVEVKMPTLPANASCRAARLAYIETWALESSGNGPADLSEGQFGMVLGRGGYIQSCAVPESTSVNICAAVQNGQVLGATVATSPRAPTIERCIDRSVRSMDFPVHPRLDVTRTVFRGAE